MLSKIFLTGLLGFFLTGGIVSIAEDAPETIHYHITTERITKAVEFNGEIMPLVELPTVEITGTRNTANLVEAILVDGHVFPNILLDEVTIYPAS